jgi:hypothetical protein
MRFERNPTCRHERLQVERKPHLRARRGRAHCGPTHQLGAQGLQVVVGGFRKARVRERQVQVAAVAADAFAHRALEVAEAPKLQVPMRWGRLVVAMRANGVSILAAASIALKPSAVWQTAQLPNAATTWPRSMLSGV